MMKTLPRPARWAVAAAAALSTGIALTGWPLLASQAEPRLSLPNVTPSSVVQLTTNSSTVGLPSLPLGLDDVVAVSTSNAAANRVYGANLALLANGTVVGWGADLDGALDVPATLDHVVGVDLGEGFALALRSDGSITGWGSNASGALDVPSDLGTVTAVAALGPSADCAFGIALRADGTVAQWGGTEDGGCYQPMAYGLPDGLTDVVAISAGASTAAALKADGTVITWGQGTVNGRDGVKPSTWTDITSVSTQNDTVIGVRADGTALTYGIFGESGVPSVTGTVAAGAGQTAAYLKTDGSALVYDGGSKVFAGPFQAVEGGRGYALAITKPAELPTPTPTDTPTASDTPTATDTPTPTDTATPSDTPTDTATPSETPTDTATPSESATPTDTPTPSDTPTPDPAPALLGSNRILDGTVSVGAGSARAFSAVAAQDGTAGSLSVFVDASSTASAATVAVYGDFRGEPGRLLSTATITTLTTGDWNTVAVPRVCLKQSQRYWLAVRAVDGDVALRVTTASGEPSRLTTQRRFLSATGAPKLWLSSAADRLSPASLYLS